MIRFLSKLRRGGAATATVADARPRGGVRLLGGRRVSPRARAGGRRLRRLRPLHPGGDGSGGTISVVGYSTPQELYEEDAEPAFNQTPDGEGVTFKNSFGASGDQSRAVEAGLPADIMHFALAPRHGPRRRGRARRRRLGQRQVQGDRRGLRRLLRRPQGQPGQHHHLGPGRERRLRRRHPEPVHLRRRPLEHHGRLRGAASTRASRPRRRCRASSRCCRPPWSRTRAPATRWGRSPAARATSCSPTRTTRSRLRTRARTSITSSPTRRS